MTDTPVPAALKTITDQAEAKARYALVDAVIAQLTLSAFPQPVLTQVGTFEDPEWVLVCPWCGKHMAREDGIIEVDAAFRWNYGEAIPDIEQGGKGDGGILAIRQGDGNFNTLTYLAACCETPIDLPDGWGESW